MADHLRPKTKLKILGTTGAVTGVLAAYDAAARRNKAKKAGKDTDIFVTPKTSFSSDKAKRKRYEA